MPVPPSIDPRRGRGRRARRAGARRVLLVAASLACTAVWREAGSAGAPSVTSAAPTDEAPKWQRVLRLSDGRTFVADGAFALDATLARPPVKVDALGEANGKVVETTMSATLPEEFRFSSLKPGPRPRTYITPGGILLNAVYVDYLRRTLPEARLRLRAKGERDPLVVVLDGRPVGVVMPMVR